MADGERPDPAGAASRRGLDPVAVQAALRRMSTAGAAPWLHREIGRRLVEHLDPLRLAPTRVVEWWAGPGGATAPLAARFPESEIVRVEPGAGWIAGRESASRGWWRRLASPRRARAVRPVPDDPATDAALAPAQLVVSNMALHAVFDVPALFARWNALLDVEGVVAFACLGPGTLGELRALYAEERWPSPTPAFTDMHDLGDMLVEAGFSDPVLDQETVTLTWADPAAALAELRGLGGNASPQRFAGLRTSRFRDALVAALARRADATGRIALSFEVAYGHGFKAAPRRAAGDPVEVSLASLRAKLPSRQ